MLLETKQTTNLYEISNPMNVCIAERLLLSIEKLPVYAKNKLIPIKLFTIYMN